MHTVTEKYQLLSSIFGAGDFDSRKALNVQFWCPFCKHVDPKKRKLSIRLDDGVVHCWVCGWSARTPTGLAKLVGASEDALRELTKMYGDFAPKKEQDAPSDVKAELPEDFLLFDTYIRSSTSCVDADDCLKYLKERNVTLDSIRSLRLGYSKSDKVFSRRIMFPSFDEDGCLNYVVARAIDSWKSYKYTNTKIRSSNIVFNEIDVDYRRELVLVEGPMDVVSCVGLNATCMLGSWLDENYVLFNKIVVHRTPIVLALDPDASSKQWKIANRFMQYDIRVRFVDWSTQTPDADPCSVGASCFKHMVKQAPEYTKNVSLMSRLDKALDSVRLVK